MQVSFYTSVENKIGFLRCYALYRDQARKHAFYGSRIEFSSEGITYFRKEGEFRLVIEENIIHLHMSIFPDFVNKRDDLISLLFKPTKSLANNVFEKLPYKVFGTGLSRTGTTSLSKALELLGIFCIHHAPYLYSSLASDDVDLTKISEYDAFVDSPFSYFYKKYDEAYPGSKFIHTQRDPDSWVKSMEWLLGTKSTPASQWFYGIESFDREKYMARYLEHQAEINQYFKGREDDFLVLNLGAENNWQQLCDFLGKSLPTLHFPNLNKSVGHHSSLSTKKIL